MTLTFSECLFALTNWFVLFSLYVIIFLPVLLLLSVWSGNIFLVGAEGTDEGRCFVVVILMLKKKTSRLLPDTVVLCCRCLK